MIPAFSFSLLLGSSHLAPIPAHPLSSRPPSFPPRPNAHLPTLLRTPCCVQDRPPSLDTFLHRSESPKLPGTVHLVGTGPGDPSLLTLQAVRLMQDADVVLYDRLVSDEILSLVGLGAQMVYVGKQAGYHTRSQQEIQELLGRFASEGRTVVRLKGGDPYVFGRGGEEVEYLERMGVQVKVTPGITAAAGIGAELGIPMTSRGMASSARFVTGHARATAEDCDLGPVDADTTLVVYMGLGRLKEIVQELQRKGLADDTPATAVERGCTAQQRVVWAHLKDLPERVAAKKLVSPTLVIIGRVVAMARGWRKQFEGLEETREVASAQSSARQGSA